MVNYISKKKESLFLVMEIIGFCFGEKK